MAKGSVRKKGKKWYYRFYVEDASGNLVQKELAGTKSKSETEKLLRQAMDDYDSKKFIAKVQYVRYNNARHKTEIGPTKRKKVRVVDFGDTLADILRATKKEQHKQRFQYGQLYHKNYYKEVREKNRVHYEYYHLDGTQEVPMDYTEIFFVCLRTDGCLELPSTVEIACRTARKKVPELEGFHFHTLRHTYTTNLLANGAQPKDVQELLGHSDVSTTMNVYAHATREAKRSSAKLLDKVVGQ